MIRALGKVQIDVLLAVFDQGQIIKRCRAAERLRQRGLLDIRRVREGRGYPREEAWELTAAGRERLRFDQLV